jgi:hypothetical protein
MPKSIKSVAKGYIYNTNPQYKLDSRKFESIIEVLEKSRDNLNKPQVAHICLQVESANFNKSSINTVLTKTLSRKLKIGYGYFLAMEKSDDIGFHIHIMLTFSTGSKYAFTILNEAITALYDLESVNKAIALDRMMLGIDGKPIRFKKNKYYFHDLTDTAEFKDAVHRYSYLSKNETKDIEELKGIRLTQSKIPKADKTKQEQKKRTIKISGK